MTFTKIDRRAFVEWNSTATDGRLMIASRRCIGTAPDNARHDTQQSDEETEVRSRGKVLNTVSTSTIEQTRGQKRKRITAGQLNTRLIDIGQYCC